MSYFVKDGYMFSFDLKSGYHNVDIAQEHQTFLGFSIIQCLPIATFILLLYRVAPLWSA